MTGFKEKTLKIAAVFALSSDDFEAVGIHVWPSIMQKIEKAFVKKENSNTKFNWWLESFKGPSFLIDFENDNAFRFIDQIVAEKEKFWFVVCDSEYDPSKFWLFQGYIKPIQKIIGELPAFEYYIISKKYEWLLCGTDHGILIGLGSIIENMKQVKLKNNVA